MTNSESWGLFIHEIPTWSHRLPHRTHTSERSPLWQASVVGSLIFLEGFLRKPAPSPSWECSRLLGAGGFCRACGGRVSAVCQQSPLLGSRWAEAIQKRKRQPRMTGAESESSPVSLFCVSSNYLWVSHSTLEQWWGDLKSVSRFNCQEYFMVPRKGCQLLSFVHCQFQR